jgi:mannose-6-phosphate isomerase-like protein (cupin superfamily)
MTDTGVRAFDPSTAAWEQHPLFPAIQVKALETKASHPAMSLLVVRVSVGGVIETHTHKIETETAIALKGQGVVTWGEDDQQTMVSAGQGVTIHPGTPHSLRNIGAEPMELLAMHTPGIL